MNCCGHTLEGVKFRNEKNKNFFEFIFWWIYLSQHKKAGGKLCVLVRIWKLMTIERRRILTKAFIEFAWLLSSCGCSLRNSDAKYVGNNMPRRFQNFSVCLGNNSAKKKKKCRRLSRNLCTLHWQWLRHTSAFCQGLWFVFLTVETTCST